MYAGYSPTSPAYSPTSPGKPCTLLGFDVMPQVYLRSMAMSIVHMHQQSAECWYEFVGFLKVCIYASLN